MSVDPYIRANLNTPEVKPVLPLSQSYQLPITDVEVTGWHLTLYRELCGILEDEPITEVNYAIRFAIANLDMKDCMIPQDYTDGIIYLAEYLWDFCIYTDHDDNCFIIHSESPHISRIPYF